MQPTSTNQVPGSTNPYNATILRRGSFTITPVAQATGYIGGTTVSFTEISGGTMHPVVDVFQDISGGGGIAYRKCPATLVNASGNVSQTTNFYTFASSTPGGNQVDLIFSYYNLTSATATTFYYIVYSTAAAPPFAGGSWV